MHEFSYTDVGSDRLRVGLRDLERIEITINDEIVFLPISVAEKLASYLAGLTGALQYMGEQEGE